MIIDIVLSVLIVLQLVVIVRLTSKIKEVEEINETIKEDIQKIAQNVYLNNLTERALIKIIEQKQDKPDENAGDEE